MKKGQCLNVFGWIIPEVLRSFQFDSMAFVNSNNFWFICYSLWRQHTTCYRCFSDANQSVGFSHQNYWDLPLRHWNRTYPQWYWAESNSISVCHCTGRWPSLTILPRKCTFRILVWTQSGWCFSRFIVKSRCPLSLFSTSCSNTLYCSSTYLPINTSPKSTIPAATLRIEKPLVAQAHAVWSWTMTEPLSTSLRTLVSSSAR